MALFNASENVFIAPVPPGYERNYENPPTNSISIYVAAGVVWPILLVFVGLRIYSKIRLNVPWTLVDHFFHFSLALGFVYMSLVIYLNAVGRFGTHLWDKKQDDFSKETLMIWLVSGFFLNPVQWLVKLNLFFLYLQVFGLVRWLKIAIWVGSVLSGLLYFALVFMPIVSCAPHDGHAQIDYLNAQFSSSCTDVGRSQVVLAATVNIVVDIYVLVLPIPNTWALNMSTRRKIGVSAIFLTGIFAIICSILGLYYRMKLNDSPDVTWDSPAFWTTTIVEVSTGLMIPCMPAAAKVFGHIKPKILTALSSRRTPDSSANLSHFHAETPIKLSSGLGNGYDKMGSETDQSSARKTDDFEFHFGGGTPEQERPFSNV